MTIPAQLSEQVTKALKRILGENLPEGYSAPVTASQDLRFGDYQSNAAMVLAKQVRTNPRELASKVVEVLNAECDMATVEIAGPGFINFRISPAHYAERMAAMLKDERLGVPLTEAPKTLVIDFSAPNVAKPMHVGHIRSTIIGDTLARLARFMGHTVITDNHIGDWGTQFGMILWGWKNLLDHEKLQSDPIATLLGVYKEVNQRCKEDPQLLADCKV